MLSVASLCHLSFVALTCSTGVDEAQATANPPAVFTARQIKDSIWSTCDRIKSLRVTYKAGGYDPRTVRAGTYIHRRVIAKAPCFLFHDMGHGYPDCSWEDDLYRQTAYITATHECNVYRTNRAYFVRKLAPDAGLPGSLSSEVFFLATGIWPLTGRRAPRPNGYAHVFRDVAKSEDFSQVRPYQEVVDGRWCHVLVSKSPEYLWLDASRGCCLVQRETYDKATGALKTRYKLHGQREIREGIWMPSQIQFEEYDVAAPTNEGRCRKVRDTPIEIVDMSVNDVDDRVFQYIPPPGALQLDADNVLGPARQSQPGGLQHLDSIVSWVSRYGVLPSEPAPGFSGYSARLYSLLVFATILACECWIRIHRRRRTR